MDYSKTGSKLITSVYNSERRAGRVLNNLTVPVNISPRILNDCDEVVIKNRDTVAQAFNGKPLNKVAEEMNQLGEISHKFQGLYSYKHYYDAANIEKYFKDLKISGLYRACKENGLEGVYTYLLNKEAAGVSPETLKKLDEILKRELESLNIDMPMVEIKLKEIVKKSDTAFLPHKIKGFVAPKESAYPAYTDAARAATQKYLQSARLDERIPDGFRDGGRSLSFDYAGKPIGHPYREIFIVDIKNDKYLNQTVQQLKEIINRNPYMSYEERMKTLYTYVNDLFTIKDPLLYTEDFPLMPMKIGDIIASGAGVCRHTALVAKLLGDEIGLNISLVRGKTNGGHIWNEVILPNGKKYLFDATKRALIDVESKDPFLGKYSFNGRKLYT